MYSMTPNEVKVIHNGLSNLTTAINELEDIIHPTLMKRLREAKCSIAKGFKPIRDQADKEFDDKANLFDEIKMKNKFSSVWSIYEVNNIYGYSDITVGEDAALVYHNVSVRLPAGQLTWFELWKAADEVITMSGDDHHLFIESFRQSSISPTIVLLGTGS
jgi:hypothetical protein